MPIYLDYAATTPVDERVKSVMDKFLTKDGIFYNASSSHYQAARDAKDHITNSQIAIANCLNADPDYIYYTSGATEANNLILKGIALEHNFNLRIVVSAIEHKCILDTCKWLESKGVKVEYVLPDLTGRISPNIIRGLLAHYSDIKLVSIMYANNEIGTIQPIEEISQICYDKGVTFHTDATQAAGKIRIDFNNSKIDFMTISAHKIYGPKGIGALLAKSSAPKITPLIHGGSQQGGVRAGTFPLFLIAGMGAAFEIANDQMESDQREMRYLTNLLWDGIKHLDVTLNGARYNTLPQILNVTFNKADWRKLIPSIEKELQVSSGSACACEVDENETPEGSYVLQAIGNENPLPTIRFSLGRYTSQDDIYKTINIINEVMNGN